MDAPIFILVFREPVLILQISESRNVYFETQIFMQISDYRGRNCVQSIYAIRVTQKRHLQKQNAQCKINILFTLSISFNLL